MTAAATLQRALPIVRTKREATVRARLALIGVTMVIGNDDRGRPEYVLTYKHRTRITGSIDEVEALADEAGAPA